MARRIQIDPASVTAIDVHVHLEPERVRMPDIVDSGTPSRDDSEPGRKVSTTASNGPLREDSEPGRKMSMIAANGPLREDSEPGRKVSMTAANGPLREDSIDTAARHYFGESGAPRDHAGLANYFRSRKIAFAVFTVDERLTGRPHVSNEEVIRFAADNADVAIAFASLDPTRGPDAVREAKRLVATGMIHGLKLHPPVQQFFANDRIAYPLYEVFAEAKLPVLFHTGHSGIGTGVPGGAGIRLKYGNPMPIDDVAVDFPELPIIMAHPSFPWQDEAISICLHKPTVYIDLSGWSPKYFPPVLVHYANTLLKHKVLFGSDYPWITPDRWLADFEKIGIKDEVRPLILKENAARLFGLR